MLCKSPEPLSLAEDVSTSNITQCKVRCPTVHEMLGLSIFWGGPTVEKEKFSSECDAGEDYESSLFLIIAT